MWKNKSLWKFPNPNKLNNYKIQTNKTLWKCPNSLNLSNYQTMLKQPVLARNYFVYQNYAHVLKRILYALKIANATTVTTETII